MYIDNDNFEQSLPTSIKAREDNILDNRGTRLTELCKA
jgi:hypothetical protein